MSIYFSYRYCFIYFIMQRNRSLHCLLNLVPNLPIPFHWFSFPFFFLLLLFSFLLGTSCFGSLVDVFTGYRDSSRYNDHLLRIRVHWKWFFHRPLPLRNLVLRPRVRRSSFILVVGKPRGFISLWGLFSRMFTFLF